MKSLSILGTSSDSGKSWLATAVCALLRRRGYAVAPFKAQNMSNNSFVTLEGGEMGRAQAVQAEACGLRPIAEMNPILLKPCGDTTTQVVYLGKPGRHIEAGDYYETIEGIWQKVAEVLDWWKSHCDVLVMEGAGSPVELNLMDRDVVNLRPIVHTNGRWLLACDIERGGVFAQAIGTVGLMPKEARRLGLGLVINKFRGDPALFAGAERIFAEHLDVPMLGTLPMRYDLRPESEDGFSPPPESGTTTEPLVAWVALPRVSNTTDAEPWTQDTGVRVEWVRSCRRLEEASVIVLPGTKNTLADLDWLRREGLAEIIKRRAAAGVPVVGICGGYQMLGREIDDPDGIAGQAGSAQGLHLLPMKTTYLESKCLRQVTARSNGVSWRAYEIHMGLTAVDSPHSPLVRVHASEGGELGASASSFSATPDNAFRSEGCQQGNIWGTYLHGLFEAPVMRRRLTNLAGISRHETPTCTWSERKHHMYDQMADLLEEHLNLDELFAYLDS